MYSMPPPLETVLIDAMRTGKFSTIRAIINDKNNKIDVNKLYDGNTPLHWAAFLGSSVRGVHLVKLLELVEFLVEAGADINKPSIHGSMPFYLAVTSGSVALVECFVVKAGANIHTPDQDGNTPLHFAIQSGSIEMVKYLLEKGAHADIHTPDNKGNTPLHWAAQSHSVEMVKYLVEEAGARSDINKSDNNGRTPLHCAARGISVEVVKYLVENGARSDIKTLDKDEKTPLHLAVEHRSIEIVKYLAEAGVDPQKKAEAAARETLEKNRVVPDLLPPSEDMISKEPTENPMTTTKAPMTVYTLSSLENWLGSSGRNTEPMSRELFTKADIIPAFSARNVFLVAARNALKKLDADEQLDADTKTQNNVKQFDRKMVELELSLLTRDESIPCAEHYLEQFRTGGNTVYLPPRFHSKSNDRQQLSDEEKKNIERLQKHLFGFKEVKNSKEIQIAGEIAELKEILDEDGSIKAGLVKKPSPAAPLTFSVGANRALNVVSSWWYGKPKNPPEDQTPRSPNP